MYTDYHAEAYFLQILEKLHTCVEDVDAGTASSAPGHGKASSMASGTSSPRNSFALAGSLTPKPEIPAK